METLNDRAANLFRSSRKLKVLKDWQLQESILSTVRTTVNSPRGLCIRGYAAFGFLATADRRTSC